MTGSVGKVVGWMGDGCNYEYVVAMRAVQTLYFLTVQWARLQHPLLGKVSNWIINIAWAESGRV